MTKHGGRNVLALEWLQFGMSRLVAAAAEEGLHVHLLTQDRSEYAYELTVVDRDHLTIHDVDTQDAVAVTDVARRIGDVAGLLSTTDTSSLVALAVREELGLGGPEPEGIRLARDKTALRSCLYEHGLSRAPGTSVGDEEGAARLAERVGLPLIVKDSAGTSSEHIWLARTPGDLERVLREVRECSLRGHATAEPYFRGPLYSVETLSWGGHTRVLGVNSRQLSAPPVFREEALSFPVSLPSDLGADLVRWIEQVLKVTGYTEGFAHTEFIMTRQGFEVVEINPRLAGALVGEAIGHSFDCNVYRAFIDLALRRRPGLLDAPLTCGRGAAQVLVYAPEPGTYREITGTEELGEHPGVPVLYPVLTPGTHVRSVTDQDGCVAMLLATGASAHLALQNALSAAGQLRVRMEGGSRV
ncbi:ATP-grasp domain-containing protein [Streptomyces sp. PU-14G]|uniref:ATP-grasp domain-containing protein n=1 Tax=Streptomyces sp. PU-14G TaxID=2800808 RepID=UPI0034E05389